MNVMTCIDEYVGNVDYRIPIFTNDIYKYVEKKIPDIKKDLLNEYVLRYQKSNPNFIRYQKGIYYKTLETPFGKADISYKDLIKRVYISDEDSLFGYESGPSFMNKIGLTTQLPTHTYLVTKKNRVVLNNIENLVLIKAQTTITEQNYRYLQLLDVLDNKYNVKIEAENYKDILRTFIDDYKINFEKLMYYAKYYKSNKVYTEIADLAREEE